MNLHICKGLPGSGKTMFLRNLNKTLRSSWIINVDSSLNKDEYIKSFVRLFKLTHHNHVLIDGLFLNEEALKENILLAKQYKKVEKVFIYDFMLNREQCLINDAYRFNVKERIKASEITIKNHPYEKIHVPSFKKWGKENDIIVYIEKKKVYKMDKTKQLLRKLNLRTNYFGHVTSKSWSLGGTTGSYSGKMYNVSGEAPPISFEAFDQFVSELVPNITFMQYRLLLPLVHTDEETSNDYYGGSVTYGYYYFKPEEVISKLKEMKLIN